MLKGVCKRNKQSPLEANEQMAVVDWLRWHNIRFSATANGIYTHPVSMSRMKRLGVSVGIPDILIFDRPAVPGYVGTAIELKRRKGGVVSDEQKDWLTALKDLGWATSVCKGADEAIEFLTVLGYGQR